MLMPQANMMASNAMPVPEAKVVASKIMPVPEDDMAASKAMLMSEANGGGASIRHWQGYCHSASRLWRGHFGSATRLTSRSAEDMALYICSAEVVSPPLSSAEDITPPHCSAEDITLPPNCLVYVVCRSPYHCLFLGLVSASHFGSVC